MPTINDIADKLGISKGTVSKALNGADDVSETLRKKVLETAVEIGYERNRVRKDTANRLCIIVENIHHEDPGDFGHDIVMGFKKLAVPAGWEVDVVAITEERQKEISYDAFMLSHEYKGAFIIGMSLLDPWMEELKTARTPAVLYDNYIQENPRVGYIGVDNEEAYMMAIRHLYGLGHTQIGYLGGDMDSFVSRKRHDAFLGAMDAHGLTVKQNRIGCSYFISECTQKYLPRLLNSQVTAIVCATDLLAQAVIVSCMDMGCRVPEDVSIIGFDDAPFAAYTSPALTTIRQNQEALGRCGFYALNSLISRTYIGTLLLRAELITRASTASARRGKLTTPRKIPNSRQTPV